MMRVHLLVLLSVVYVQYLIGIHMWNNSTEDS